MSNRGRIDVSGMTNNVNVFAALSSSRKKKSKGKSSSSSSAKSGVEKGTLEKETFWTPAPLNVKSWADVDDEDDDDYYATTAPPQAVWGLSEQKKVKEESLMHVEESESDEDVLGEEVHDLDDEHDSEPDIQEDPKPIVKHFAPATVVKEPEKQLSKKEIRKKELEELDALLADLKITPNDKNGTEPQGAQMEKKESQPSGEVETSGSGPTASKNSKKKKKKAKSSKEVKDIQTQSTQEDANIEEDTPTIDVKEQLKKLAAIKKKKPSKETDNAAKSAAAEAAARRQKVEAVKKKEKSHHYNQQPVR